LYTKNATQQQARSAQLCATGQRLVALDEVAKEKRKFIKEMRKKEEAARKAAVRWLFFFF
jgi:hypothetical protein